MNGLAFSERLLAWHAVHGRHDLPWQQPRTPYRVWVSEIMLQQTQVSTVLPYFQRFIARFPDLETLAIAPLDDVLAHWSGLGYYARARNLHACAHALVSQHGGRFPEIVAGWEALPGIGRSTAGAIVAQAFNRRAAVLDGNVRRVLARHAGVAGWTGAPTVQARLWLEAESRLPDANYADYAQASMDLGNLVCTARRPVCADCPVNADCIAYREQRLDELPSPKPRRHRPSRAALLILLRDDVGRIFLEQRPPRGIWGGLWSPPVLELPEGEAEAQARWPSAHALPDGDTVNHSFTHFDLAMTPRKLQLAAPKDVDGGRWTTLTESLALGLPAPVRRVLQDLES